MHTVMHVPCIPEQWEIPRATVQVFFSFEWWSMEWGEQGVLESFHSSLSVEAEGVGRTWMLRQHWIAWFCIRENPALEFAWLYVLSTVIILSLWLWLKYLPKAFPRPINFAEWHSLKDGENFPISHQGPLRFFCDCPCWAPFLWLLIVIKTTKQPPVWSRKEGKQDQPWFDYE